MATVTAWILAAVLNVQPSLVLEIYPDTFKTEEDCVETGRAIVNAGYQHPLVCFGATKAKSVGGPSF